MLLHTLNRLQNSVKITFICATNAPQIVTHFTVILALLKQSGTEFAVSPRYLCTLISFPPLTLLIAASENMPSLVSFVWGFV